MKFLVSDHQSDRHERIRSFLTADSSVIAALLAAVDLEWTIRRVIDMAVGGDQNRLASDHVSGLDAYAKAWRGAFNNSDATRLKVVVPDWSRLVNAYRLRNDIVHGRQGTAGVGYTSERVNCILEASVSIANYGREHNADPYRKLRKRAVLTGPTIRRARVAASKRKAK